MEDRAGSYGLSRLGDEKIAMPNADPTAELEALVAKAKATEQEKALDNAKRERFCQEYIVDCNATQAATRAGYSKKTAYSQGQRLLKDVEVGNRIAELQKRAAWETQLTAEYVLTGLMDVYERCMAATPARGRKGEETGKYTFNAHGANKALELLGKHLKLFTEKTEHNIGNSLADALAGLAKESDGQPGALV